MTAGVLAAARDVLGAGASADQPLMEAGLDSLGAAAVFCCGSKTMPLANVKAAMCLHSCCCTSDGTCIAATAVCPRGRVLAGARVLLRQRPGRSQALFSSGLSTQLRNATVELSDFLTFTVKAHQHRSRSLLLVPAGAVELRNALMTRFGVELPPTVTFDFPTVSALANFIATHTEAAPAVAEAAGDVVSAAPAADLGSIRYFSESCKPLLHEGLVVLRSRLSVEDEGLSG